eukprot:c8857_g1_i1.p1 GENE.c8857_g1_i1~~c8857_g1_i1.p1  ORF type:complete len:824 (-),score=176.36 c8857_g1_i1:141-2555(-)
MSRLTNLKDGVASYHFYFDAVMDLINRARDSKAKRLRIMQGIMQGKESKILCLMDDGKGSSRDQLAQTVESFLMNTTENRFKAAVLKVAASALLLTRSLNEEKKTKTLTAAIFSMTHCCEKQTVSVPMLEWDFIDNQFVPSSHPDNRMQDFFRVLALSFPGFNQSVLEECANYILADDACTFVILNGVHEKVNHSVQVNDLLIENRSLRDLLETYYLAEDSVTMGFSIPRILQMEIVLRSKEVAGRVVHHEWKSRKGLRCEVNLGAVQDAADGPKIKAGFVILFGLSSYWGFQDFYQDRQLFLRRGTPKLNNEYNLCCWVNFEANSPLVNDTRYGGQTGQVNPQILLKVEHFIAQQLTQFTEEARVVCGISSADTLLARTPSPNPNFDVKIILQDYALPNSPVVPLPPPSAHTFSHPPPPAPVAVLGPIKHEDTATAATAPVSKSSGAQLSRDKPSVSGASSGTNSGTSASRQPSPSSSARKRLPSPPSDRNGSKRPRAEPEPYRTSEGRDKYSESRSRNSSSSKDRRDDKDDYSRRREKSPPSTSSSYKRTSGEGTSTSRRPSDQQSSRSSTDASTSHHNSSSRTVVSSSTSSRPYSPSPTPSPTTTPVAAPTATPVPIQATATATTPGTAPAVTPAVTPAPIAARVASPPPTPTPVPPAAATASDPFRLLPEKDRATFTTLDELKCSFPTDGDPASSSRADVTLLLFHNAGSMDLPIRGEFEASDSQFPMQSTIASGMMCVKGSDPDAILAFRQSMRFFVEQGDFRRIVLTSKKYIGLIAPGLKAVNAENDSLVVRMQILQL